LVPLQLQLEAMDFLERHIFTTPTWLLDTAIISRIGQSPIQLVRSSQEMVLNDLLGSRTLAKLADAEATYGNKSYRLLNFMGDIDNAMWKELKNFDTVTVYRRNLQRLYTEKLLDLVTSSPRADRLYKDVVPIAVQILDEVQARLRKAVPKT